MPTVYALRERLADMLLGYSDEKRKTLENRRIGADNKDKGTEFERHYGVYHLMQGAFNSVTRNQDGTRFYVSNNLIADADDLYVSEDDWLTFVQAKDRLELSWSAVSERLEEQLRELRAYGLEAHSTVELVVSRENIAKNLKEKVPPSLVAINDVHFETNDEVFLGFAERLTARETDQIGKENARHHYYDAWRTLEFSATASQVARRAHRLSYGTLRTLDANVELPKKVEEALAAVEFLTSRVIGRRLYDAFKTQDFTPLRWEIESPQWKRFANSLCHSENLDYIGFLNLLEEVR
jgi:hypothetical protein